jgi:hypothetical protein
MTIKGLIDRFSVGGWGCVPPQKYFSPPQKVVPTHLQKCAQPPEIRMIIGLNDSSVIEIRILSKIRPDILKFLGASPPYPQQHNFTPINDCAPRSLLQVCSAHYAHLPHEFSAPPRAKSENPSMKGLITWGNCRF